MPPTALPLPVTMPRLSVQLHGDPLVQRPDGPAWPLRGRAAAVVALAALEPGVPRERVAALLWPDAPNPRQNLRQQLLRFKQALGSALVEGDERLQLAAGVVLEPARHGAELLAGEPPRDDDFGRWLQQQRAAVRRAGWAARADALARAERDGDLDRALQLALEGLAGAPGDELAAAALMRVHYLRGDAAAGLAVHRDLVQQLSLVEGRLPSAATRALAGDLQRAVPPASLQALTPRPATALPVTLQRPPRPVGRAAEWLAMQAGWDQGLVLLLDGEAGLGKSRLLGDWLTGRDGVVAGAGRPGDTGAPYATLARWLLPLLTCGTSELTLASRQALQHLGPTTVAQSLRPDAMAAAVTELVDRHDVVVLALDDLHFADDATLDLVAALAAPPHPRRRWVLAQRPAEADRAARRLVDPLAESQRLCSVRLQPLDEAATAALVDDLGLQGLSGATLAGTLVQHTGGNPLFVLETLKQGLVDGSLARGELPRPIGVGALIERRLMRLSEPALQLARIAAIAGVDFSIELAEAATGQRALQLASAWQELQDAQVLRDEVFAHDLVADAVLRGVPPVVARRVHAQCAHWLAVQGVEPARVAVHWMHGGDPSQAGQAFMAAGMRARQAARTQESAALFAMAAQAFDSAGLPEERFTARCERGLSLVYADFGDQAKHELQDLLTVAESDAQRLRVGRVLVDLLSERGESLEAVQAGETALAQARRLDDHDATVRLTCHLATALCRLGRAADAATRLLPLQHWVDTQGDDELRMLWHGDWAATLDHLGRLREAVAAYDEAQLAARRSGSADAEGRLMMNCAVTLRQGGQFDRALALSRQGRALSAGDPGDSSHQLIADLVVARDEAEAGCFASALATLERTLPGFEDAGAGFWSQACRMVMVPLWLHLGQPARAVPLLRDEPDELPAWLRADRLLLRLDLARTLQQAPPAGALQAALDLADTDPQRRPALVVRALGHLPPAEAVALADRLVADLLQQERLGVLAALHVHRGEALLALGRSDDAAIDAEDLLALLGQGIAPDSMYRAKAWWWAQRAFLAARREAAAAQTLADGARWITQSALPQVPPAFIDSFLHRNAVNRDLLAAAAAARRP
jgi:DNA-binding SARP family transcriptional activator/tetratricopeptide (TPR) repeat protein